MFFTVYISSWDEASRRYVQNLVAADQRHKVIDIDENYAIAASEGIKAIPTTKIFNSDGELISTKIGAATKEIIKEWIKESGKS